MPFLRFSRDRRGYEYFCLVEPVTGRRGKTHQRVLYWFRTPPNVKVGRQPFDPGVMRALEAQYPAVRFDWEQLRNTPIPSVEPEYWRERRRADRAARRLQEEEETQAAAVEPPTSEPDAPELVTLVPQDLAELADAVRGPDAPVGLPSAIETSGDAASRFGREGPGARRRRRRRRGQRDAGAAGAPVSGEPNQTESSADASIDADDVTSAGPDGPDD